MIDEFDMAYEDRHEGFHSMDEMDDGFVSDDEIARYDEPCDNSFVPDPNDKTVCQKCGFDLAEHIADK